MQTKQYLILWSLVKKYGRDNDINTVNKDCKGYWDKKVKNKLFRVIY